ncbi:MAG: hypothetical protein HQL69_04710 [Magnetococcales bacterium]|nr:hypothetical protein [Magnetococcales bacterium]
MAATNAINRNTNSFPSRKREMFCQLFKFITSLFSNPTFVGQGGLIPILAPIQQFGENHHYLAPHQGQQTCWP